MIYFTRQEQRIIFLLGVIMLLGIGVLLVKRFEPGWIMRLSMGKPDFDVESDQISPRLKSAPPGSTDQTQQRLDQNIEGDESVSTDQPAQIPAYAGTDQDYRSHTTTGKPKININTAGKEELEILPGIGPVLAQRIIDYREEHGKFEGVDDLMNVRGIGDITLRKIRDLITATDEPPSTRGQ